MESFERTKMNMTQPLFRTLLVVTSILSALGLSAQTGASGSSSGQAGAPGSEAVKLAATVLYTWPDSGDAKPARWTYDEGVVWRGLEDLWLNTGDARYFKYIQRRMD